MSETPVPTQPAEPVAPPPPIAAAPPKGGFLQNLLDVYFAPRDAFRRIVAHPRWLLPAIGMVVLALGFVLIWISKMDAMEFARTTLEQSPFWDRIPPEQRSQVIEQTAGRMKYGWINALVGSVIGLLLVSLVLMFVYRFFYAGEVTFKRALAIVSWTFFAISLVTTPLTLAVFALKGDWNLNPQDVLQANLSLFLDKASTAKPLWALATSLDLISFWYLFLLAAGFGVACRKTTGQAFWGVAIPWALMVLVKVAWSAIF